MHFIWENKVVLKWLDFTYKKFNKMIAQIRDFLMKTLGQGNYYIMYVYRKYKPFLYAKIYD